MARGLVYTAAQEDLEVIKDAYNPNTLRWDDYGVDSTVAMIFWARDFNQTALSDGNIPNPLNLTGFHANGISEIALYNNAGGNPTLFQCLNVVPVPALNPARQPGTDILSWVTSDLNFTPTLQRSTSLGPTASWQTVTNALVITGLTSTVTVPAPGTGTVFYRLQIL